METINNLFLHKVASGIVIHSFKNQAEQTITCRLSRKLDICVSSVYKNVKKLEDKNIIERIIEPTNRTNRPFKLTQKGEQIAVCLLNIK